ncbi:MAG: hypothetical protein LBM13_02370 [Candidatus Ancillula sp.]|jgi:hypothetical protein|nr:hypothetical protein [Candidatus Ancillula sp.]
MQKKYIFVTVSEEKQFSNTVYAIFDDIFHCQDVDIIKGLYSKVPKFLRQLWLLHTSKKINDKFHLPLQGIWGKYFKLKQYSFKDNIDYYIIFQNNSLIKSFDYKWLNRLAKKENIHLVYYTFDAWESELSYKEIVKKINFEKIYTYSPDDAKKYGFELFLTPYSILYPDLTSNKKQDIKYSIEFVGMNSDFRKDLLSKIDKEILTKKYLDLVEFNQSGDIITPTGTESWNKSKALDYKETLKVAIKSNVILEIAYNNNYTAPTLRYYEAVVYNKKLLTNIKNIKNFPFYNSKYMRIFEKIEDINQEMIDWIKQKETIDYGYDGLFSPSKLLEKVSE